MSIMKNSIFRYLFLGLLNHFLFCISAFQKHVPSNFYGSPEVFSGYLSNSEVFIESFTLHDDHINISGSTREVEYGLQTINTKGKKQYLKTYFCIKGLYNGSKFLRWLGA